LEKTKFVLSLSDNKATSQSTFTVGFTLRSDGGVRALEAGPLNAFVWHSNDSSSFLQCPEPPLTTAPAPGCPPGTVEVGVRYGSNGCAAWPVCGGNVGGGNCPDNSYCALLSPNVYGCTAGTTTLRSTYTTTRAATTTTTTTMTPTLSTSITTTSPLSNQRNLTWSDEFNSGSTLDPTKWIYNVGAGGYGNNELQTYTNSPSNVRVEGGNLVITAVRDAQGRFTSGRVKTQGLFDQKYGRFESRIAVIQLCSVLVLVLIHNEFRFPLVNVVLGQRFGCSDRLLAQLDGRDVVKLV
jgi:hypothetical protein